MSDARRRIPQVERLVRELEGEADGLPRAVLVQAVRRALDDVRRRARRGAPVPRPEEIEALARAEVGRRKSQVLRPVINATGVILHTNLGRAPLSRAALEAVARVAGGYSNLELDLETGRRGDRFAHVEPLLEAATGGESALVVNNNAAAVLLACAALARGREVVISRGELIEIGGEFRIPEVLAESGALLREVGTTNRTHLRDYERAIGDSTALVLKVHPSNYRVVGFTTAPAVEELAALTRARRVPLMYDVGSGLLDREMGEEPLVSKALRDGADLVCFSGDKLLGGPQAGIVCGRRSLVAKLRRHPLLRAVRPGKMTLAALGETVLEYLRGTPETLPVHGMLESDPATLARRTDALAAVARDLGYRAEVVEAEAFAGAGSLPGFGLRGPALRLTHAAAAPQALSTALRRGEPPVVARVETRALVVDLRAVPEELDPIVVESLRSAVPG